MKRDKYAVEEIIEEIEDIENFIKYSNCKNVEQFLDNEMLKKSVMMSIINISEQTKYLSQKFLKRYNYINFDQFREIRNIAAHKYGTINFVLIWNIIKNTLPHFKEQIAKINYYL